MNILLMFVYVVVIVYVERPNVLFVDEREYVVLNTKKEKSKLKSYK